MTGKITDAYILLSGVRKKSGNTECELSRCAHYQVHRAHTTNMNIIYIYYCLGFVTFLKDLL